MAKRPRKPTAARVETSAAAEAIATGAGQRFALVVPCAIAFLASFCVMTMELVAGRIIARHVGASLYTWTSVIGVVLAGLTVGHYVGGLLADRYPARKALSTLLILASACCLLSLPLNQWVGNWEFLGGLDWPTHVAVHVTLIFLWPAAVLGTIAPTVAKMALDQGRQTGRTVGSVYAWGAAGSIVGTFMTGYWFIAAIGATTTIALVSGVLAMMGVLLGIHSWLSRAWVGVFLLLALLLASPWSWARAATVQLGLRESASGLVLYQSDSAYSFIKVENESDEEGVRSLTLDHLIHSYSDIEDASNLRYDYEQVYAAATRHFRKVRREQGRKQLHTLFIGGGGYTFPRFVEAIWPDCTIDVVEIDPDVTAVARRYLGLDPNSDMRIHHLDARNYVDDLIRAKQRGDDVPAFDFVYGDAYNDYAIPFHLTTLEYHQKLRELMADDGVYMLNAIDVPGSGRLIGAMVNTLEEVFEDVAVYTTRSDAEALEPTARDTFVIFATPKAGALATMPTRGAEQDWPGTRLAREQLEVFQGRVDGLVLTDDFAPVERLVAPIYQQTYLEQAHKLNDIGLALAMKGRYAEAVTYYRRALRLEPDFPEAESNLGWALFQQGKRQAGIAHIQRALDADPTLASAHNNLGWAHYQQGDIDAAIDAYHTALSLEPEFALAQNNLGLALAKKGQLRDALQAYFVAVKIQPSFAEAHYNLASALMQLDQPDQAVTHLRRVLSLKPEHPQALNDLGWVLHCQGQHAQAEEYLQQAVEIDPHFTRARNNLATVLIARGAYQAAVSELADLLSSHPGNVDACNTIGIAYAKWNKPDQAVKWFREALKFKPDHEPARNNLLAIYLRAGQFDRAIELLRSSLEHAPDSPAVLSNLAWLLATCPEDKLRNGEEAVRLARQADQISGHRSARVLDTLGAAYAQVGQFDQARTAAQKAEALARQSGNSKLAEAIKERLEGYQQGKPARHRHE